MDRFRKFILVCCCMLSLAALTIPTVAKATSTSTLPSGEAVPAHSFWIKPKKLVALGDSFQAGFGGAPYIDGTATPTNQCFRSTTAAPILADNLWWVPVTMHKFVACNGAATENIATTGQFNEPPQVAALDESAQVVTVEIGGNDIKLGDLVGACLQVDCTQTGHTAQSLQLIAQLGPKLDAAFQSIKTKAPNAKKPVAFGYPSLLPKPGAPQGPSCPFLNEAEIAAGQEIFTKLNTAIKEAAKRNGFIYGEFNWPGGPFEGKDICSEDSYFYPAIPDQGFLHPNEKGRAAMAKIQGLYMTYAAWFSR